MRRASARGTRIAERVRDDPRGGPMFVGLDPATRDYYRQAMDVLDAAGVPFLVGGAYAMERYTGIARHTKDFDVFVRPQDSPRALESLKSIADLTELTFPHWLGKAFRGD